MLLRLLSGLPRQEYRLDCPALRWFLEEGTYVSANVQFPTDTDDQEAADVR